ncbi:hypothetical protein U9M48_014768 [Paspalum notatum var. saurae]|uniref:Reverse transcriptase domain-containing protein n=1 Tax=Paspalum notatum var. saurae TaxID=547442 RepID=A0AAQ3T573_PASNO
MSEIKGALCAMDKNSAPGPDGVGSAWYAAAWETVKEDLFSLFECFYRGDADLERVNRAHIVLLPKQPGASTPHAFRPISLQNCPVKIITKVLTTRLQRQIGNLIDMDQTGFMKGRSISENFVYATELVQSCYRRRRATLVLKLDFAKAFDSVEWCSLMDILRARGFPDLWCSWMEQLLKTSKSAILVNGQPGPWISCKKGLRQGDALSPYLFLMVADVLQQLIKRDGGVRHPITDDPCPVLQYADDTLILVRASVTDIRRLRKLLDDFSAATGLKINYEKSTAVPMHVQPAPLARMIRILQCKEGTFPQTYLGLPLSNYKLNMSAFAPLIAKVDKRLSGWSAMILSQAGRVVLINSVLSGLPIHLMTALQLPAGVIKAVDAKRRSFLWTGTDTAKGGQCLVAWENACRAKEDGGLGIKRLDVQNSCLLLKLVHRLFNPGSSSWAHWARGRIDLANFAGEVNGAHWDSLRALLPAYRCLSRVAVGDGSNTNFWLDVWHGDKCLAEQLPALYSHSTDDSVSIKQVLNQGIERWLVPRLSSAANRELSTAHELVRGITLSDEADEHVSCFSTHDLRLDTAQIYRASTNEGASCQFAQFVWKSYAPPRVKFFGWLTIQERLQCKTNLLRKNMIDDSLCDLCSGAPEDGNHLLFECPFACSFWEHIGWSPDSMPRSAVLWQISAPENVPSRFLSTMILLCCWQLWKHRHDVVFRGMEPSLPRLLASCKTECRLWSCRLPKNHSEVVDRWCDLFSVT